MASDSVLLRKTSSLLFLLIIGGIAFNMLVFLGTSVYFSKTKKTLAASGLKDSDPIAFEQQVNSLNLTAGCLYALAMGAILFSGIIALKRSKIVKKIQLIEQKELDQLDIK